MNLTYCAHQAELDKPNSLDRLATLGAITGLNPDPPGDRPTFLV
jgi:hypothetical protein